MKNLIIGETSQLSYFFPDDYERISSRNVNMSYLHNNKWDSVYITFAEQRVHMNDINFIKPNYIYTLEILENIVNNSNKVVVYTTCELWNNYVGKVSINDKMIYTYQNDYCLSKRVLVEHINDFRKAGKWKNIIILHPFNFNSTYRKPGFLFGKIFDSLINKTKIEIGDTRFYRDIIHTKYVVERSIEAKEDQMVGSGRLTFINDYIKDLYSHFDMDFNEYVKENLDSKSRHSDMAFYSDQEKIYTYDMLLKDTIEDVEKRINNRDNKR